MKKPDGMVGRDHEWRTLERFLKPRTDPAMRLGIVSGRRRAGKTYLLAAAGRAMGGLYHACVQEEGDLAARNRFAATIAGHAGVAPQSADPGSWEQLLRTAMNVAARTAPADSMPLVVIDEFPYAMIKAPELPGVLQLLYDQSQRGEGPGGNLILCGSSLSIMRELLSGTKPLRGRAMVDLRLGPLDYRQAAKLWGIDDPETFLRVHACVGGYPGYRQLVDETPSRTEEFDRWVPDTLLSTGLGVFTHAEVDYLLREDPRITDRAMYYDVLSAIATGSTSLAKIGAAIGRTKDAVRAPLSTLRSTGYVTTTTDLLRNRDTVTISDPIIRFDRLITAPHLGQLELGQAEQVWSSAAPTFRSQILGPHFEELAREWVRRFAPAELQRPAGFGDVGMANIHDHNNRAKHEIDILGLQGKTITFLGEAKATIHSQGLPALDRLRRIRLLLNELGYQTDDTIIGVFSRTGFTGDLRQAAQRDPGIVLVDLERLFNGDPG